VKRKDKSTVQFYNKLLESWDCWSVSRQPCLFGNITIVKAAHSRARSARTKVKNCAQGSFLLRALRVVDNNTDISRTHNG